MKGTSWCFMTITVLVAMATEDYQMCINGKGKYCSLVDTNITKDTSPQVVCSTLIGVLACLKGECGHIPEIYINKTENTLKNQSIQCNIGTNTVTLIAQNIQIDCLTSQDLRSYDDNDVYSASGDTNFDFSPTPLYFGLLTIIYFI